MGKKAPALFEQLQKTIEKDGEELASNVKVGMRDFVPDLFVNGTHHLLLDALARVQL